MRLVISLATRGRPQQLLETIRRSIKNLRDPNTLLMVQIDEDDSSTVEAFNAAISDGSFDDRVAGDICASVAPREDTIAAKWNRARAIPADLYLIAADDDPYITPGYDAKLLEAAARFPDGIGMVYGHMANLSFSGVLAPTAKFAEKLGHIVPQHFPYWFCDHWIDDICRHIGRVSFADVRTDQSAAGKTQELREPGWWGTWFDAAYLMRRKIVHDIIRSEDFHAPAEWKDMILTLPPAVAGARIDNWSRYCVNEGLRQNNHRYEEHSALAAKDERYQRVKQKAIDMIPHLLDDYGMDRNEAAHFRNALIPPTQVMGLKKAFA